MNECYIYPIKLESHFTIVANEQIRDPLLSWAARSLLTYLLSLPAGWRLSTKHLAEQYQGSRRGNGIDAIRSMLTELKEETYITYKKNRNADGTWRHDYYVFPLRAARFKEMFPERVKPDMVDPGLVNADISRSTKSSPSEKKKKQDMSVAEPPVGASAVTDPGDSDLKREELPLKITLIGRRNVPYEITIDDLWREFVASGLDLKASELRSAYLELSTYGQAPVHDWWAFVKGFVRNQRNMVKSQHAKRKNSKTSKEPDQCQTENKPSPKRLVSVVEIEKQRLQRSTSMKATPTDS